MFFGPQPLKQELNSISGSGQTNPYRGPEGPVPSDFIDPAKLNDPAAKKLEIANAVKLAGERGANVREGSQITDLLTHLRGEYNKATTKEAKQEIWRTTADLMRRATNVNLLLTNGGKAQNAATYLGEPYEKIKAPTQTAPSSAAGGSTQGAGETSATSNAQTSNTQSASGATTNESAVSPEIAAEINSLFPLVQAFYTPGATNEQKKVAYEQLKEMFKNMAPNYPPGTFDLDATSTMKDLQESHPGVAGVIARAFAETGIKAETFLSMNPAEFSASLLTAGLEKDKRQALNVLGQFLGQLRVPTSQIPSEATETPSVTPQSGLTEETQTA